MRKDANGFFLFLRKFRNALELEKALRVCFPSCRDLVELKSKEFFF